MSHLAHAVRELRLRLPWGGQAGPQAERGEVREFIKSVGSRSPVTAMPRRGQYSRAADTRLPDDAGGFRVCGEVVT